MDMKLAWRNLWRNKRRTLITAASVFFAVLMAIFMQSLQKGGYAKMIENVVEAYSGYIQIQQKAYWEERTLENSLPESDSLVDRLSREAGIEGIIPRLEAFALASSEKITKGCQVVGIDPEKEDQMTRLKSKLDTGAYLQANDKYVLIASGLAERLKLELGDSLILLGQGYHGVNARGLYPIKGIVEFGSPALNDLMVYLPLKEAQFMFGAEGRITSYALQLRAVDDLEGVMKGLRQEVDTSAYAVMDWKEMNAELDQAIESDNIGGIIYLGILYLIVIFGMFGTLLMMTAERRYEFGILVAIGMKKAKLSLTIIMEIIFISFLGVIAGSLASIPLVLYFIQNPIEFSGEAAAAYERFGLEPVFPTLFDPAIFINQAIFIFIVSIILSAYPVWKIFNIRPVDAMRS